MNKNQALKLLAAFACLNPTLESQKRLHEIRAFIQFRSATCLFDFQIKNGFIMRAGEQVPRLCITVTHCVHAQGRTAQKKIKVTLQSRTATITSGKLKR